MSNTAVKIIKPSNLVQGYGRVYPASGFSEGTSLDLPLVLHITHSDCQMKSTRSESSGSDGSWRTGSGWGERTFEVSGRIIGASASALQDLQATINAFCSQPNLMAKWNGNYLFLTQFDRQTWRYEGLSGNRVAEVRMTWFCSDPYWYEATNYYQTYAFDTGAPIWSLEPAHGSLFQAFPILTFGGIGTSITLRSGDTITVTETSFTLGDLRSYVLTIPEDLTNNEQLTINHETGSVYVTSPVWTVDPRWENGWLEGDVFPLSPSGAISNGLRINFDTSESGGLAGSIRLRPRFI